MMSTSSRNLLFRGLRLFYLVALIACAATLFLNPPQIRTDLFGLLGKTGTTEEEALVSLSRANSSRFQILIEADDSATAKRGAEAFSNALPEEYFRSRGNVFSAVDVRELLDYYIAHGSGLLSDEDREALLAGRFSEVEERAIMHWLSPVAGGVPASRDPFGLLSRFLIGLPRTAQYDFVPEDGMLTATRGEKTFVFLSPELKPKLGLNEQIAATEKIDSIEIPGVRVHASGIPFHSAATASASKTELNVLTVVGAGTILALLWILFRSLRFLVPVSASIAAGVLGGTAATALLFPQPHVMTFVFGTTLVGLAVDYSFHFYLRRGTDIRKPLLMAFLTTAISFSVLALSSFPVLRQMAVFSIVGLLFVLGFVLIFAEKLLGKTQLPERITTAENFARSFSAFCRRTLTRGALVIVAIVVAGMFFVSLKDDVRDLYRPSTELAERDRFFMEIAGVSGNSAFCIVPGKTCEDVLRLEESANLPGVRLSAFLPSEERQRENAALVRELFARGNLEKTLGISKKFEFAETPPATLENAPSTLKNLSESLFFRTQSGDFSVVPVPSDFNTPTGTFVVRPAQEISSLLETYRQQTYALLATAFAALFAVLIFVYRRRAFRLLFAPVAAIATVSAVLGFCGIPLSFFHFLSFFLIVGFSLDYGIFRMEGGSRELPVALSCATSVLSFGLLAFTSFALTRSMGIALGLGLAFAYFYSSLLSEKRAEPTSREWFEQKEQCAGRFRLALLWGVYRFCPQFVFKTLLALVGFGIFLAARPARNASRTYRKILNAARERRGLPPAKFSTLAHLMTFTFSVFDKFDAAALKKNPLRFLAEENEDFREFRENANRGNGMFFLCSHVGNIEMLQSFQHERSDFAPRVMHAFQDFEQNGILLEFFRRHCRAENLFLRSSRDIDIGTAAEMQDVIARGELVMMAADRVSAGTPTRNIEVSLLDEKVPFPRGVFTFARLMECPVFFVACVKTAPATYTLFVEKAPAENVPAAFAAFLEKLILRYPLSFFHFYDYFRN